MASVSTNDVREFLTILVSQAKAALTDVEKPGYLQMSRLHPVDERLVPTRYRLDDLEGMIRTAVNDSNAGHNVYIEGRTVRETLRGTGRGTEEDTSAVFALVVDSDGDKDKGWTPTIRPSVTVATSPGNFQFWFFSRKRSTSRPQSGWASVSGAPPGATATPAIRSSPIASPARPTIRARPRSSADASSCRPSSMNSTSRRWRRQTRSRRPFPPRNRPPSRRRPMVATENRSSSTRPAFPARRCV